MLHARKSVQTGNGRRTFSVYICSRLGWTDVCIITLGYLCVRHLYPRARTQVPNNNRILPQILNNRYDKANYPHHARILGRMKYNVQEWLGLKTGWNSKSICHHCCAQMHAWAVVPALLHELPRRSLEEIRRECIHPGITSIQAAIVYP